MTVTTVINNKFDNYDGSRILLFYMTNFDSPTLNTELVDIIHKAQVV